MMMLENLARLFRPRQKAAEGEYRPGPYLVGTRGGAAGGGGGWLPNAWGQFWNYWQMDYDPQGAPGCSIVEACVWAYIRAIAQLPGYHKRELENGGTETVTTSALSRLLRTPNGYETPSDFLVHLIRSLLYTGNSYWIAERNDRHEVSALHWTDPRQCHVREVTVRGQATRELWYEIGEAPMLEFGGPFGRRQTLIVPARDVFHVKLATPRHPLIGETWLCALALELANRGAINYSASVFSQNMSRPSGVLTTDLTLTAAQVSELRERWNAQAAGLNAGGVPILTSGLKFQPIAISNEDAQIIEQLKLSDRTIAAVFGVPAILIGIADGGSQKSAEAVMAEWLASGLGWLINHIEVAFDAFIGLNAIPAGREWTEYDTRALLRSLYKERIDGLVRGVQGGLYAPNEARALEGYPSVEAGDEPRLQAQVVPLSFALEPPAVPAAPAAPAAPVGDEPPDDADEPADEDEARAVVRYRLQKHMERLRHEKLAA